MLDVVDRTQDDCWNRVGVAGDGSCPELARHDHCRNCPVSASAARDFFRRSAPEGYLREWSDLLARPVEVGSADQVGLLVFRLGVEWLALGAAHAVEVTEPRPVHRVPHRTNAVFAGLVNLRGQLHPCVSLHGLLGVDPVEPAAGPGIAPRLVVARADGEAWAFRADEVAGVRHVARADLQHVPSTLANPSGSYSRAVFGWDHRSVNVLDEPRLFGALRRMGA
jgi:chemotaxis-related protein WspD